MRGKARVGRGSARGPAVSRTCPPGRKREVETGSPWSTVSVQAFLSGRRASHILAVWSKLEEAKTPGEEGWRQMPRT